MPTHIPEWDGNAGMWVGSDGSPASATNYASVETAEGLAPLSGGTGGAAALGIGLGGAGLGAAAVAALKAKFGSGAAAGTVSAAGSPSRPATGRAAGTTPRARAPGQGSRFGAKVCGAPEAEPEREAGSRNQMRGDGAGGRGDKAKDKREGGPDIDLMADHSADYSDEEYERLLRQKRFEEEQKRQIRTQSDD